MSRHDCYLGLRSIQGTGPTVCTDLRAGEPYDFVLDGLSPNTRYYYRLRYESGGRSHHSDEFTFHTQRDKDSSYVFTVQADSHLDENTNGEVYLRTLGNALADQPDFHFALGDTFMTGKYVKPELSEPQYLAQRYYLGHLCHSAALYFALGNHDGESGNRGSNIWAVSPDHIRRAVATRQSLTPETGHRSSLRREPNYAGTPSASVSFHGRVSQTPIVFLLRHIKCSQ